MEERSTAPDPAGPEPIPVEEAVVRQSDPVERFGRGLIAFLECGSVVGIAVLLTLLPLAPFIPVTTRAEFPLEVASAAVEPDSEGLVAELNERVAGDVKIVERSSGRRLRVDGASMKHSAGDVGLVLARHGYVAVAPTITPAVDTHRMMSGGRLTMFLAVQAAVLLLVGGLMARWRVGTFGLKRGSPVGVGVTGIGFGLLAFVASAGIASLLDWVGIPVSEQEMIEDLLADVNWAQLAPWFVLILPLAEEMLFRGYVFAYLQRRAALWAAYLGSASLFALVHLNLSGFLVYLVVGIFFAAAYRKTGNFTAAVLAHVTYNGTVLSIRLLAEALGVPGAGG